MSLSPVLRRHASTAAKEKYKVLVVGGGTAGLSVSNQIFNKFKAQGKALNAGDVAVVDAAQYHHYQVWSPFTSSVQGAKQVK
jgi:sulfide:quinone oxidoreductase